MNSDKAAAVRDSIRGLPAVIHPEEDLNEEPYGDAEPKKMANGDTHVGPVIRARDVMWSPPVIEQVGELGNGDGTSRPVFVVKMTPVWTNPDNDPVTLSPDLVHEVAKHGCRIRVYSQDHDDGPAAWICDHFGDGIDDADKDRCQECDCTRFTLDDGVPECARCGEPAVDEAQADRLEAEPA